MLKTEVVGDEACEGRRGEHRRAPPGAGGSGARVILSPNPPAPRRAPPPSTTCQFKPRRSRSPEPESPACGERPRVRASSGAGRSLTEAAGGSVDPRVLTAQTAPWRRCSEIARCSFTVGGPFGRGQSRVEAESGRPPSPQGPGPHRVAGPAAQCQEPGRQLRELGACVSSGGAVPGPARACRRRAVLQGGGAGPEPAGFVTLQTAGRGAEWAEDFATVLVSRQKCVSLRPGEGHRQTNRLLLLTSAQVGAARRPGQGGPTVGRRPRASPRRHPWPCAGSQEARGAARTPGARGCLYLILALPSPSL